VYFQVFICTMKKYFFVLLLFFSCFASFATHTKGGWMYYEYLGPGRDTSVAKYKIVLYLYMVCNPSRGLLERSIDLTVFTPDRQVYQSLVTPLISDIPNIQNCPGCDQCIINKPDICYKYARYEVTTELPISNEGYTISYQKCCRITGIANIASPSDGYGDVWTIKIPGTENEPTAPMNSSPKFISNDTAVICANNSFTFDFTATDPDGDALVYEFAYAYTNSIQSGPNATPPYDQVPYAAPFSPSQPLGSKVTLDPKTGKVSGIAPGVGEYVLTVLVKEYRNGVFIAQSRKSLHIQVASCNLVIAALLDDNKCDGFRKTFVNNVPDPPGATYSWDFGVPGITTDVSNEATPTYIYPDTGTYKVTLTLSLNGACANTTTALVRIYPKFDPAFITSSLCTNTPIQFTDKTQTTYGIVNKWSWDFGDSTNNESALQDPQHIFTQVGRYNVALTVSNSKGCINTISQAIVVKQTPTLPVTSDTLICSIDTLQLNAVGTGTILWTPNYNISNQNISSPLVSPDVPTTYYVTLTEASGCKATDSVFVDVKLFALLDAGKDTAICAGDVVQLKLVSDALYYRWSPAASLNDATIKEPIASPTVTTKFYVTGNIGKCQSMDSVTVSVAPYPGAAATADTALCFAASIQLNASGGSIYTWSPSLFLNDPNIPNPIATPTRSIQYVVTIRDTLGCSKTAFDTVLIQIQQPKLNAGPRDTSIVQNQPLQLNATGGQLYLWTPSTGLNNPSIANPVALLNNDIEYIVTTKTSAGCIATDTISVKVYKMPPGIYVPNAFTPNGDGINDIFRPIAIGMKQVNYFKVFNRAGVLIYSNNKISYASGIGWDGRYKGILQMSAVYVWIAEGIDYLDKKITQKGTVTLIR
jgi:gliding motility-associated-like protein